jgi:hypothetical protein
MSVGAERTERYRGHELAQVEWYYVAKRNNRVRFTATTIETLKQMIRDANPWKEEETR